MNIKALQTWCMKLEEHTGVRDDFHLFGEMTQEFAELTRSFLALQNVKIKRPEDSLGKELFDFMYNVMVVAAKHNMNVEEEFRKAITKYEERFNATIWSELDDT